MTARINVEGPAVVDASDALDAVAPLLGVRPEFQDFCRFGGDWRAVHGAEEHGWAAFHIVTKGRCEIERGGMPAVVLEAGDVLLLPHGDGHVVYGGGGRHSFRQIGYTYRDYIRVKQTEGPEFDTELVCGRLHLEGSGQNLILRALPAAVVLKLGGSETCSHLVRLMRGELDEGRAGAGVIAGNLASALFVMLLRHCLERDPPTQGLLALLTARETAKAAAAMLGDPARDWGLDEMASLAAVSRATLVRAFRRLSGMPPQALLTEMRLGMARNRILHGTDTLAQIAADVGYQSETALSRAFVRRYGLRPGAMRKGAEPAVVASPR